MDGGPCSPEPQPGDGHGIPSAGELIPIDTIPLMHAGMYVHGRGMRWLSKNSECIRSRKLKYEKKSCEQLLCRRAENS